MEKPVVLTETGPELQDIDIRADLDLVGAGAASLQFAILAFKDVPMGARMAHRADPLDEG